jgi:hypothetical protein
VKRLFWIAFGASAGILVARRLRETAAELRPTNIVAKAWIGARDAWQEIRDTAAEREDELRASFGLDGDAGSDDDARSDDDD